MISSTPDRPISVIYKTPETENLLKMTILLLETVSLYNRLPEDRKALIALKPNLVVSRPAEEGATTHPEICEGIIIYLQSHGYKNIVIVEGSWVGDSTSRAFRNCGYEKLAQKTGVKLFNTQNDDFFTVKSDEYTLKVCNIMHKIDFLINIPVLKGHCQTSYTGALKNLKGCIPDSEKRHFHSSGLHRPIAELNTVIKQDFIVMDGICGDPTFEEGGSPSTLNRILCSDDPVMLDSYAATLIGLHYSDISYISLSAALKVGSLCEEDKNLVLEINTPVHKVITLRDSNLENFAARIDEQDACSSCYTALIGALKTAEKYENKSGEVTFAIGRAFRGAVQSKKFIHGCIGIGNCTAGFTRSVPGCPPAAEAIRQTLSEI
ncbi:MAG: DUF362 domain-containing protein [Spirochaetia bacterium]|nr:DUF362 domain-containing protein [Spirochaetia bacterium]